MASEYSGPVIIGECKSWAQSVGGVLLSFANCWGRGDLPEESGWLVGKEAWADEYWPTNWDPASSLNYVWPPVLPLNPPRGISYYESLARLDLSVLANVSGRNMVRLLRARRDLDAFEVMAESVLKSWAELRVLNYFNRASAGREFTTEEALRFCDAEGQAAGIPFDNEVLDYVLHCGQFEEAIEALARFRQEVLDVREQIDDKAVSLEKLLPRGASRFCGLSWTRRFWFLIHGSHPPRAERWQFNSQAFGCAGALAS